MIRRLVIIARWRARGGLPWCILAEHKLRLVKDEVGDRVRAVSLTRKHTGRADFTLTLAICRPNSISITFFFLEIGRDRGVFLVIDRVFSDRTLTLSIIAFAISSLPFLPKQARPERFLDQT